MQLIDVFILGTILLASWRIGQPLISRLEEVRRKAEYETAEKAN